MLLCLLRVDGFARGSQEIDPSGGRIRIAITKLEGKAGASQETVDLLVEMIAKQISSLGDVDVITWSDVVSILDHEKKKRLTGCTDDSCVAKLGNSLDNPRSVP